MKKIKHLLYFFTLFVCNTSYAQNVEKGDETVTPYYGPSLFKNLYNPYSNFMGWGSSSNYKHTDKGTFGISYEYMVNDLIGLGGDIFYSRSETSWTESFSNYNPTTGMGTNPTYSYKVAAPTFAVLGRMNFHYSYAYSMFSDDFNSYLILAIGYKKTNYMITTNDPDYSLKVNDPFFSVVDTGTPLGGKIGAGFRYFPNENIALTLELVFRQPFLAGGLTFKF